MQIQPLLTKIAHNKKASPLQTKPAPYFLELSSTFHHSFFTQVKQMGYKYQLVRLSVCPSVWHITPLTLWTPLLHFRLVKLTSDLIHIKAKIEP